MRLSRSKKELKISKNSSFRYLKISAIILSIVFIAQLFVVNRLSTYGNKIQNLDDQKNNLELENLLLKNQISAKNSLKNIDIQAQELGFESIKKVTYIK